MKLCSKKLISVREKMVRSIYMLVFAVIVCVKGNAAVSSMEELSDGFRPEILKRTFRSVSKHGLDFVFDKFGMNSEMNRTQLTLLLNELGLVNNDTAMGHQSRKCITPEDVFSTNGFQSSQTLNRSSFSTVCPMLLEHIVKKSCKQKGKFGLNDGKAGGVETAKAWGYGILSVTIISLASMLGAFVVPFMNKEFYKKILLAMVSLAVGVLGGSGLFHLIPHTFGLGKDGSHDYLWKCSVIVGGIYFFFVTENLMKMYIRFAEWRKKNNSWQLPGGRDADLATVPPGGVDMGCVVAVVDGVHENNALDSVHVSDTKYQHEHGIDSLNMAGDHCINKKDPSEYFKDNNSIHSKNFFTRVAPVAWMIILGDGLHNFIDGLAIGVAFTSNIVEGISTSLAIFCEELPHELGDFAILLNSGLSYKQAILANFLSACTCYIGMIIGTILGSTTHIVRYVYALAGGMFLYISLVDMLPEATGMQVTISGNSKKETVKNFLIVNVAMIAGYSMMLVLALYAGNIKI